MRTFRPLVIEALRILRERGEHELVDQLAVVCPGLRLTRDEVRGTRTPPS